MNAAATNLTQTTETPKDTVSCLRQEAAKSQVLTSICHMFALRERSRNQVTVSSLMAAMTKEGFKHSRYEYVEALKALSRCDVGTLKHSKNNRVQALINIRYTLQSIGKAVVSKQSSVTKQVKANRYTKLSSEAPIKRLQSQDEVERVNIKHPAKLTVDFGKGEVSSFDIPNGISAKELGTLLTQFYSK